MTTPPTIRKKTVTWKVKVEFIWRDLWVGLFVKKPVRHTEGMSDTHFNARANHLTEKSEWFICLVPTVVIHITKFSSWCEVWGK